MIQNSKIEKVRHVDSMHKMYRLVFANTLDVLWVQDDTQLLNYNYIMIDVLHVTKCKNCQFYFNQLFPP